MCKYRDGKWISRIGVNNHLLFLGYFDTFIEAVDAREEAEKIYYGNYRRENNNGGIK